MQYLVSCLLCILNLLVNQEIRLAHNRYEQKGFGMLKTFLRNMLGIETPVITKNKALNNDNLSGYLVELSEKIIRYPS